MSSRVLRKLQGEKDLPEDIVSDPETDVPISGGARRKQLNINRYDLLNQQSHSESEVKEDDNETEHASAAGNNVQQCEQTKRKKKKRKKKSGKSLNQHRSSEDNTELDEVTRTAKEVAAMIASSGNTSEAHSRVNVAHAPPVKNILVVQHRHLNPHNEMKRMFGSKVIQAEQQSKRRNRNRSTPLTRSTWLVAGKESWPPLVSKSGLGMDLVRNAGGVHTFCYTHSASYQQTQRRFLEAVETLNPANIVAIINLAPYHVDALLQLSDLCKMSEDLAVASELMERALYALETAFHPLFNLAQGTCRLDYRRQENRALFIALFKHAQYLEGRACPRTALEVTKLIMGLDPDNDPLAVTLILDFYAIRAREFEWLVQLFDQWEDTKNLSQLPNMSYSVAVALFYLNQAGDLTRANEMLQNALLMFPSVLRPLLDKISAVTDDRVLKHAYFGAQCQTSQSPSLDQLCKLYVRRTYSTWKDPALLTWLESNVNKALDRVDQRDPLVAEYATRRAQRYPSPTPRNILRHVILSDYKEVPTNIAENPTTQQGPMLSFDPLPPVDSIDLYTRAQSTRASAAASDSAGAMTWFFQSLLPSFNAAALNNPEQHQQQLMGLEEFANNAQEGAAGGGAGDGGAGAGADLRESVTSLLDAMRELLSNLRLPPSAAAAEADVDDSDNEEEDDEDEEGDGERRYSGRDDDVAL